MTTKTLEQVVGERPFPEYAAWWPVGSAFTAFMSAAIVSEWKALDPGGDGLSEVQENAEKYIRTVYHRPTRRDLLEAFVHPDGETVLQSGEFDALSYAFYRSAFQLIERHPDRLDEGLERERRRFTIRVGKLFFDRLNRHLALDLPDGLNAPDQLDRLSAAIDHVGRFLNEQGYLRSHFAFRFDVDIEQGASRITQHADDVVTRLGKANWPTRCTRWVIPSSFPPRFTSTIRSERRSITLPEPSKTCSAKWDTTRGRRTTSIPSVIHRKWWWNSGRSAACEAGQEGPGP